MAATYEIPVGPPDGITAAAIELDRNDDSYTLALTRTAPGHAPETETTLIGAVEADESNDDTAAEALRQFLDEGCLSSTPGSRSRASLLLNAYYRAAAEITDHPDPAARLSSYRT